MRTSKQGTQPVYILALRGNRHHTRCLSDTLAVRTGQQGGLNMLFWLLAIGPLLLGLASMALHFSS